jgi:hypothetical protein
VATGGYSFPLPDASNYQVEYNIAPTGKVPITAFFLMEMKAHIIPGYR